MPYRGRHGDLPLPLKHHKNEDYSQDNVGATLRGRPRIGLLKCAGIPYRGRHGDLPLQRGGPQIFQIERLKYQDISSKIIP